MRDSELYNEIRLLMEKDLCLENALFIEDFELIKSKDRIHKTVFYDSLSKVHCK